MWMLKRCWWYMLSAEMVNSSLSICAKFTEESCPLLLKTLMVNRTTGHFNLDVASSLPERHFMTHKQNLFASCKVVSFSNGRKGRGCYWLGYNLLYNLLWQALIFSLIYVSQRDIKQCRGREAEAVAVWAVQHGAHEQTNSLLGFLTPLWRPCRLSILIVTYKKKTHHIFTDLSVSFRFCFFTVSFVASPVFISMLLISFGCYHITCLSLI